MPKGARIAGLIAVATLAGVVAYFAGRSHFTTAAPPAAAVEPQAAVIPERRPELSLADRDGKMRALSEWDGQALVINFWATWCAPCRREIPMLNKLAADFRPAGFEVIGIAVDFREDVLRYMDETPIGYPVLIGEQEGLDAARAFGIETMGFPFTVFTDRGGRIVTVHVGELHRPQAEVILGAVRQVDAGKLTLEAGRTLIREQLARLAHDHA